MRREMLRTTQIKSYQSWACGHEEEATSRLVIPQLKVGSRLAVAYPREHGYNASKVIFVDRDAIARVLCVRIGRTVEGAPA